MTRTTYRLSDPELEMVVRLKKHGTPEATAVRELTGYEDLSHATMPTVLRSIVEAGIKAIQDKALEVGYEELRQHQETDPEYRAWHESRRTRRQIRARAEQDVA